MTGLRGCVAVTVGDVRAASFIPGAIRHGRRRRTLPPMWPPEAIDFLRDLEAYDRDWFRANRDL
jgi:hypothetical protein